MLVSVTRLGLSCTADTLNHLGAQHVLKPRLKSRGDSAFAPVFFSLKTGVFSYESQEAGDSVFSFPLKLKTVL